jgi:KaiC/GvpD/RAD55 family RecA-like ATPase
MNEKSTAVETKRAQQAAKTNATKKSAVQRPRDTVPYDPRIAVDQKAPEEGYRLKMPTLRDFRAVKFNERQHLLYPWLREQESCMLYAATGVGKSLFALSVALTVAGGGEFLEWKPDKKTNGKGWRVLYVDGEMHANDIQERVEMLLDAIPGIDKKAANTNLRLLPRQYQEPKAKFPSMTDQAGMNFYRERIRKGEVDLVVLDNFSTLGEVADENAASSFNAIQEFLLHLKVQNVATILVHHAGKSGDFRGSSKLAVTFDTIIQLEGQREKAAYNSAAFRVRWNKVRIGGPKRVVREVIARLTEEPTEEGEFGVKRAVWEYEAAELYLLDDLKERLIDGELITQKEIADLYDVTPTMARKYLDKGIRLRMWTEAEVGRWFAIGKRKRGQGSTQAPVRADNSWKEEALKDDGGQRVDGKETSKPVRRLSAPSETHHSWGTPISKESEF